MIWYVTAIAVVLVLGVVAAAAAGVTGTMPESFDDRVDSRVPDGPLTEADVARVRLPVALRGYRMEEVDRLLDLLGRQVAEKQAQIEELKAELVPGVSVLAPVSDTPGTGDVSHESDQPDQPAPEPLDG